MWLYQVYRLIEYDNLRQSDFDISTVVVLVAMGSTLYMVTTDNNHLTQRMI